MSGRWGGQCPECGQLYSAGGHAHVCPVKSVWTASPTGHEMRVELLAAAKAVVTENDETYQNDYDLVCGHKFVDATERLRKAITALEQHEALLP